MAKQKLVDELVAALPLDIQQAVTAYFEGREQEKALRAELRSIAVRRRTVWHNIEQASEAIEPRTASENAHTFTPGTLVVNLRNGRVYEALDVKTRRHWEQFAHIQASTGRLIRVSYYSWGPKLPLPPEHPLYTKRANAKLAERLEGKDNK